MLNSDKVVTSSEKPPASSGEGCQVITCTVVAATGTDAHRGAVREASAKVMETLGMVKSWRATVGDAFMGLITRGLIARVKVKMVPMNGNYAVMKVLTAEGRDQVVWLGEW